MNCIFCDILNGKRDGYFIYEDESHVAFLDKYPVDVGHSLIIPRKHHEKITDMETSDVGNIFSVVPKVAKAILNATGADAFTLSQNNGKSAKQIIPHVHIHIIPRYAVKGAIWTKREIADDSELLELSKKIQTFLT